MSKKLFSVDLEIRTSPLFVAGVSLLLLGVKVRPEDDLGKYSRLLIEAGYIHFLRDAATDEHVATLMNQAREAAEHAERDHGVEPDFESCVRVFATDLLNYYGGLLGIAEGSAKSEASAKRSILKATQGLRSIDDLRENIEAGMDPEALAKAEDIRRRMKAGEISNEEALREAGAPEELVQIMAKMERAIKGEPEPEQTSTEA